MRRLFIVSVIAFMIGPVVYGQELERSVTGRVTDANTGEPLPGVNVVVKGKNIGTATNVDGIYLIEGVSSQDTLVFSFVGYQTQEVVIGSRRTIDIALYPSVEELEEVVVIGYGTARRENVTGSIAQISGDQLEDRPIERIEHALKGQMAGVQVRQTSGMPGRPLEVRVRGAASISASNEPLYVVDGIPVEDITNLNPADIASIDVLKDASAAAIYGSRAANGVVLITTKKGRSGKPRFQVSTYYGWQSLERKIDLLSPEEWMAMYKEIQDSAWVRLGRQRGKDYKPTDPVEFRQQELGVERNATYIPDPRWEYGCDSLACIDWQDVFYRIAPIYSLQITGTGGSEELNYAISGNYLDQKGIAVYTEYKRVGLRSNINARFSNNIQFNMILAPSISWNKGGNVDGKDQQAHLVTYMPPVSEKDVGVMVNVGPNSSYYWGVSWVSPVGFQKYALNDEERREIFSKMNLGIDLGKGFAVDLNGGWVSNSYERTEYYPTKIQRNAQANPEGSASDGRYRTIDNNHYLFESVLKYSNALFDNHNIDLIFGYAAEYRHAKNSYQRHRQFADDIIHTLNDSRSSVFDSQTWEDEDGLISYFARGIYNFKDRYIVSASLRRDGSSRFGPDNKWGLFPAFSLAWRISDEPFFRLSFVDDTKLRLSWGVTGNNSIPNYAYYGRLSTYNYSFGNSLAVGYGPATLSNDELGWERTVSIDVGLDLSLFERRLNITADVYRKLTEDLLLEVPVPLATGYATGWRNIGKVENKGVELQVEGLIYGSNNFNVRSSFNVTFNRNKVLKLGPGDAPIYMGFAGQTAIIKVGEPLMAYYMYDAIGVYMNEEDLQNSPHMSTNIVGDVKYRDVNGDGVINADDRTIVGYRDPTYWWGWYNNIRYKNVELSFLLQGAGGNKIYSILGRAIDRPGMGAEGNKLGRWRNRWRSPENPGDGKTPRIDGTTGSLYDSRWLYDATYVRLKNVTISYTLPAHKLISGLSNVRIYVSGENLYLYDHYYGGYSPEAESNEGGDYGTYPVARTITVGLNFEF